jgi:dTDP-4-dehydrorhamnose 3,5-epimerase-like enzyme
MIYTAETRADTTETKQMLEISEMSTLQQIIGKMRIDVVRSQHIRHERSKNVMYKRGKVWTNHVSRMTHERTVPVARAISSEERSHGMYMKHGEPRTLDRTGGRRRRRRRRRR